MVIKGGLARLTKAQLIAEVERLQKAADKTYNGWPNYETWNVALWIDNDECSYRTRQDLARSAWRDAWKVRPGSTSFTQSENARYSFAEALKSWIEGENPIGDSATVFTDLLNAALSEVQWQHIADNWLAEEFPDEYEEWR